MSFRQLFVEGTGTGRPPYPFQERLASATAARIYLNVPTGAGKTAAAFFAWLWQRRFADESVCNRTPRRLIYCLPMRVLVEQTRDAIEGWLQRLGLGTEIAVIVLMGGEEADRWDLFPERDAVLIGTQDMLLSRALNRGYGMSRYRWPMHFGLVNNDCRWVVDEVQLMGSGLTSSAQLQAFRERFGTIGPVSTLWMSATFMPEWLRTIDFNPVHDSTTLQLADDDLCAPELRRCVNADKKLRRAESTVEQSAEIANEVIRAHRPASRTLVVVNTVARALNLYEQLQKLVRKQGLSTFVVLIHSRFRPNDRRKAIERLLAAPQEEGTIIISTQVVEAGVDVSAATLFTELAPWPSLVQRFGRCNRTGEEQAATVHWFDLPVVAKLDGYAAPYELNELTEARKTLGALGQVGPASLPHLDLATAQAHVIRSKDLVELFDTTPDLAGRDIDVSRFIRESSDLDVQVFWRDIGRDAEDHDERAPTRDELCPAPVTEIRELVREGRAAWTWDGLIEKWRLIGPREIYPGVTLMLRAADGGYTETEGWNAKSRVPVPLPNVQASASEGMGSDRWAENDWMSLSEHTDAVVAKSAQLGEALALSPSLQQAVIDGARWHDAGKAHHVFQKSIRSNDPHSPTGILAKGPHHIRHERPGFRHELASGVLALMHGKDDLVAYLAASHHGKVRLSIRSLPNERRPPDSATRYARGVFEGEIVPEADLGGGVTAPATAIDLSYMDLGGSIERGPSWLARMLNLRDRDDLGPFRLALLEALLKAADERASGAES
jgi:CRISPR-associated endonuclease/helicase Cas3